MQQLSITLLAVFGMLLPALNAQYRRFLLAIARSPRLALAGFPRQRGIERDAFPVLIGTASRGRGPRDMARFWRNAKIARN
jgi:hypothetical protein